MKLLLTCTLKNCCIFAIFTKENMRVEMTYKFISTYRSFVLN